MDIKERKNILVTCGPGLKEYLQAELEGLGRIMPRKTKVKANRVKVRMFGMNFIRKSAFRGTQPEA